MSYSAADSNKHINANLKISDGAMDRSKYSLYLTFF